MQLNNEISEILKLHKINRSQGTLCLLGIYYGLEVDKVCSEETIKAINLTKIIDKDYTNASNPISWNVPLFQGEEIAFGWVKDWMESFGRVNPERKGSHIDATNRMKDFFKKYPTYRKDDIYKARDLYFSTLNSPQYCMHSHKFIFDGAGAMKKSTLLAFCERVVSDTSNSSVQQRGTVITE